MFKAKIVEIEKYNKVRRIYLVVSFIPSLLIGLMFGKAVNGGVIAGVFTATIIVLYLTNRLMTSYIGNKSIEINDAGIRVFSKENQEPKTMDIESITKVIVRNDSTFVKEGLRKTVKELFGKHDESYIVIYQKSKELKLSFEVDSYYMNDKLNIVINNWLKLGYIVERV